MVEHLRAKAGGNHIPVTIGNFAEVGVDGTYALIFVAFNTFFALNSQEEQVHCFANVAGRLRPGGLFLIEAFVPDPARFARGQKLQASRVENEEVRLEASRHDVLTQRVVSQHVVIVEAGIKLYPIRSRDESLVRMIREATTTQGQVAVFECLAPIQSLAERLNRALSLPLIRLSIEPMPIGEISRPRAFLISSWVNPSK